MPSPENATDWTLSVWPLSTFSSTPFKASHIHTNPSSDPETIQEPSLENAAQCTSLSVSIVINGTIPPSFPWICLNEGIKGNCLCQPSTIAELFGHVANDEMYKWGVDSAAALAVKYVAKLATLLMF